MSKKTKTRSFRISEEVAERFKHLCDRFDNQNAALDSLISAYEVQSAKAVLVNRQTDISNYDMHLQALQQAFLHSLELNANVEKRIIAELAEKAAEQAREDIENISSQAIEDVANAEEKVKAAELESTMNEQHVWMLKIQQTTRRLL